MKRFSSFGARDFLASAFLIRCFSWWGAAGELMAGAARVVRLVGKAEVLALVHCVLLAPTDGKPFQLSRYVLK